MILRDNIQINLFYFIYLYIHFYSFKLANYSIDLNSCRFSLPLDIEKFLFDYKYSKFIECRKQNISVPQNKKETVVQVSQIKAGLIYVKSVLEEFKKPYWLAAGTYLGEFYKQFF